MLRRQKDNNNMYDWVTDTFNGIKGKCLHGCSYCYMKKLPLGDLRFDRKELKTHFGKGKVIFIGSSTDMFADNVPSEWINEILQLCRRYPENKYLFQTKNTKRFHEFNFDFDVVLGTTIETNKWYDGIMGGPSIEKRAYHLSQINSVKMVTIEPILKFDLDPLVELITQCNPSWINIGADSKGNNLPEPTQKEVGLLLNKLKETIDIKIKTNLKRIGDFGSYR